MKTIFTTFVFAFFLLASHGRNALAQDQQRNSTFNQARTLSRALAKLASHGGSEMLKDDLAAIELPRQLEKWLQQHKHTIFNTTASPFPKRTKWGTATTSGNKVFLHVGTWPKESKLLIPRLHNSIKSVRFVGGDEELKLTPNVVDWEIKLGEKPKRNLLPVVEIELNEPAKLGQAEAPVVDGDNGTIVLHSRYSVVHGEMLRFEPQPHKNTVGYWVNEKDWAAWRCEADATGTYEVLLRYGCGDGQGGSDIEISFGDQKLPFQVEATGGFQAWRDVKLGTVDLNAGSTYEVTAKVLKKAKNAVMDIQQITLQKD